MGHRRRDRERKLLLIDISMSVREELSQILQTANTQDAFYPALLGSFIKRSGASAAIAWNCDREPFGSICRVMPQENGAIQIPMNETQHSEVLAKTVRSESPVFLHVNHESAADAEGKNDGQSLDILFGPIHGEQRHLIEFVFPTGVLPEQRPKLLKELGEYCATATAFLENESKSELVEQKVHSGFSADLADAMPKQQPVSMDAVQQYVHAVHQSIDYKETAANIANEGRNLLDCDRVSIAIYERGKFNLRAINGQPSVNRRSNTVKGLQKIARQVLKTGQTFWYPSDEAIPPQIEQALASYLSISATRSLVIEPVFEKIPSDDPLESNQKTNRVVGGIIAESCSEQWEQDHISKPMNVLLLHGGDALRNSLKHRRLFLYPVWNFLGKSRVIAASRNLPKTLLALGTALAIVAVLCFVPAPMNVVCDGEVVPKLRDKLYAEAKGTVKSISVNPGDTVRPKQPLISLEDTKLAAKIEELNGAIDHNLELLRNAQLEGINNPDSEKLDSTEALQAKIESLRKERKKHLAIEQQLVVKSRINGQVISWDFKEKLRDRPIEYGDMLLEIAEVNGQWELVLQLPDKKIAHIMRAKEKYGIDSLVVKFVIASEPNVTYEGKVRTIAGATQLQPDQKQSIRVVVDFESADLNLKHVRAKVNAKIYCGHRSLGYVWLHPVGEFIQSQVLFRIW